jgi:hypothetical protein
MTDPYRFSHSKWFAWSDEWDVFAKDLRGLPGENDKYYRNVAVQFRRHWGFADCRTVTTMPKAAKELEPA